MLKDCRGVALVILLLKVWMSAGGDKLAAAEPAAGSVFAIPAPDLQAFALSADGRWIAWSETRPGTFGRLETIRLFDCFRRIKKTADVATVPNVFSLVFSPDSSKLLAAVGLRSVKVWSVPGLTPETVTLPISKPWFVGFGGGAMLVGGTGGSVWAGVGGAQYRKIGTMSSAVAAASATVTGGGVVAVDIDSNIRVWDGYSGQALWATRAHIHPVSKRVGIQGLGVINSGAAVLTAGTDGCARAWSLRNGSQLWSLQVGVGEVDCMSLDSDGKHAAIAGVRFGADGDEVAIKTIAIASRHVADIKGVWPGRIRGLAFHPDGRHLVVAYGGRSGQIVSVVMADSLRFFLR